MFEYQGRTKGIIIDPGSNCEVLVFEFDETLFVQQSCKTQYAGMEAHIHVINLLRNLYLQFSYLNVMDETGYWQHLDKTRLQQKFEQEHWRTRNMMLKYGE